MGILLSKVKEVLSAVSPVVAVVLILHFTLTPLSGALLFRFVLGAAVIAIGLSILLLGLEIGIIPFGNQMGQSFLRSNRLWFVLAIGLLLGFFINIAEPDLQVLARQVTSVMGGHFSMATILVVVSVGTGVLLALGIARIVKSLSLRVFFAVAYGLILVLAFFASADMLAIGFDASGATTGALTVPFVLALSVGVAALKADSHSAEDDSFGLVGIMSAGAIVGVLALNLFVNTEHITGVLELHAIDTESFLGPFFASAPRIAIESIIALSPMVVLLLVFQRFSFHLPTRQLGRILLGLVYTCAGLILFLEGVNAGFMDVGNIIGHQLANSGNLTILVVLGFILGMLVILTEPAVHILTRQIEGVTSGYIKRRTVLATLSIGVAVAVGLAMLRIAVAQIQLWHYLLPGYVIALALMRFVPKLFVGIAFDSGGVASGPMTATFVLAFAQGASEALEHSDVLLDAFGVIAMVAMTPLIALQVLGLIYKLKSRKIEV